MKRESGITNKQPERRYLIFELNNVANKAKKGLNIGLCTYFQTKYNLPNNYCCYFE